MENPRAEQKDEAALARAQAELDAYKHKAREEMSLLNGRALDAEEKARGLQSSSLYTGLPDGLDEAPDAARLANRVLVGRVVRGQIAQRTGGLLQCGQSLERRHRRHLRSSAGAVGRVGPRAPAGAARGHRQPAAARARARALHPVAALPDRGHDGAARRANGGRQRTRWQFRAQSP